MSHAPLLQPSSAHRWVHCHGSPKAALAMPDEVETEAAREGTAAHWAASESLEQGYPNAAPYLGVTAPNGVIITDEMIEAINLYIDDIVEVTGGDSLVIEKPVFIPSVHEENWGTPDCWHMIGTHGGVRYLTVWDFKFGHSIVEEYWQLINYAIGILDQEENTFDLGLVVDLRIVQPRAYHVDGPVRSLRIKGVDLRGYMNKLNYAAAKVYMDDPGTVAGKWCKHCKAARRCTTLQYNVSEHMEPLHLHDLTPAETGLIIDQLREAKQMISTRLDALETESIELIRQGGVIPGHGLGYGRGTVKWNKPVEEIIALGELMDVNLTKPTQAITPTQAKKLLPPDMIKQYSQHYNGEARLVTDTNTLASKVFGTQ